MSNNLVSWIVEEVDSQTGNRRVQSFSHYDEALDVYNHLKVEHKENFVSIQKSEKKLLTE